jgi:alkanesulfonate monooxygenase SsuD/methylene tetrahydromethanopterin reductase-like flavin-dependent oxidoreductase (luciferase family)
VKFSYFHLMPWPHPLEANAKWPVPNRNFKPEIGTQLYKTYLDNMVYAEQCGFDWVGCNEHHFSPYGLMSNCNVIGSIIIDRTKTIGIAMCGNLIPLLNPIRVAEEYAMLDVMSGGRLLTGFIRGVAHEYIAYNVAPDETWERLAEAHELIIKAWTEPEPFGWQGKHYQYRSISIWPRPLQKPHPPVMMSASNPESARFAASRRAIMGMAMLPDIPAAQETIRVYKETARQHGWNPGPEHIMISMHALVADTAEEAKAHMAKGLDYFHNVLMGVNSDTQRIIMQKTRYYRDDRGGGAELFKNRQRALFHDTVDERLEKRVILCGTPEMVVDQIKHLKDLLGHGLMNLTMKVGNVPDEVVRRSMQLWGERVAPHVHNL